MSSSPAHTGKSPDYDRAIEKLRAGMGVWDVFVATGIPVPTLKTWAKKAGIALPKVTAEDRRRNRSDWTRKKAAKRWHDAKTVAPLGGYGEEP